MPPPPYDNGPALRMLLEVFRDMSSATRKDPDTGAVHLLCPDLGGEFVVNTLEKSLIVRFLADGVGCVVRIKIRLDSPLGLVAQAIDLADHYAASDVGSALLRKVQDTHLLASLEFSIVKGLARRLSVNDLARELER